MAWYASAAQRPTAQLWTELHAVVVAAANLTERGEAVISAQPPPLIT
jgi:hypothetical protein